MEPSVTCGWDQCQRSSSVTPKYSRRPSKTPICRLDPSWNHFINSDTDPMWVSTLMCQSDISEVEILRFFFSLLKLSKNHPKLNLDLSKIFLNIIAPNDPIFHNSQNFSKVFWTLLWHFSSIFVLLKLTCLVTLFDRKFQVFKKSPKFTIFNELLSTQNVNPVHQLKEVWQS